MVQRVTGDEGRSENPDIADLYNTVLKMAKKRAFVDATITATAASDFFTQDVEDFASEAGTPGSGPSTKSQPQKTAEGPRQTVQDGEPGKDTPPVEGLKKASSLVPTKRQKVIAYVDQFKDSFTQAELDTLKTDLKHAGTTDAMLDAVMVKADQYLAGSSVPDPTEEAATETGAEKLQSALDEAMAAGFGEDGRPAPGELY
jgi:hypothetical protein